MKKYLRYFRWLFLVLGILAVLYAGISVYHSLRVTERGNTECLMEEERVFDYGDVLTDEQEESLSSLIEKRQRQTGCDIVLVTLNESLKEYAGEGVPYDEFVKVYAEHFYDDNQFGYNVPGGDGVLLVDNWFREDDGKIYTWLCTTGKVREVYGSSQTDHLLDEVYRYVEKNPYKAYRAYVNGFYHDMAGGLSVTVAWWLPLLAAAAATLVFIMIHWKSVKGKKTTTANTYVNGGKPLMNGQEDAFINKTIVTRHIQRADSSGGGSGGGGGGGSHGGGGHSR